MNLIFYYKKKDETEMQIYETVIPPKMVPILEECINLPCSMAGTIDCLNKILEAEEYHRIPKEFGKLESENSILGKDSLDEDDVNTLGHDAINKMFILEGRRRIVASLKCLKKWVTEEIAPLFSPSCHEEILNYRDIWENAEPYLETSEGFWIDWENHCDNVYEVIKLSPDSWFWDDNYCRYSNDEKALFIKLKEYRKAGFKTFRAMKNELMEIQQRSS